MMTYYYPKVGAGFRWHFSQNIRLAIGRTPTSSCDTATNTLLSFDPPLSAEEEAAVAAIMSSPDTACQPPTNSAHVLVIDDIYETLAAFNARTGKEATIWFTESIPGSKVYDQIELHFSSALTVQDKRAIKDEYAAMIRER